MSTVIFDIETGPLPESEIRKRVPPYDKGTLPKHPGEFNPAAVKYGNMKDEAKRAEKLEAARTKHAEKVESWQSDADGAEAAYWSEIFDRAALSAATGQVLAIGFLKEGMPPQIIGQQEDERTVIEFFWKRYAACCDKKVRLVGHWITGFDLPFLMRRSWILGVRFPDSVLEKERYWNPIFVDTLRRWSCGDWKCLTGLDAVARALGLPGKNGDGAEFAKLWATDRPKAIAYLVNDLNVSAAVARAVGVI